MEKEISSLVSTNKVDYFEVYYNEDNTIQKIIVVFKEKKKCENKVVTEVVT